MTSRTPSGGGAEIPTARRHAIWPRIVAGVLIIAVTALGGAWLMHNSIDSREEIAAQRSAAPRELLGTVKSWAYQLQGLDVAAASRSRADLLVVDEVVDATTPGAVRRAHVRKLQAKPDGSRRLVLAYLSIGEAEDYRPYWDKTWTGAAPRTSAPAAASTPEPIFNIVGNPANAAPMAPMTTGAASAGAPSSPGSTPAWLGDQNQEWRGNYRVRFWDPAWQALIFGSPEAALERIAAAGFDGVYLDRADVYAHWLKERPTARDDMVRMIERLSQRARALSPGFLVVLQNAEELLGQHRMRQAIDAVAKEDLLFGVAGAGVPNAEAEVTSSVKYLQKARKDGLPVLVVEYLSEPKKIADARRSIEALDFIPNFAPRALDRLADER